jgi:DNA processing protein
MISKEERLARAVLTRIAEPGDELLGRLIAREGAVGALDAVRSDVPPDAIHFDAIRSGASRDDRPTGSDEGATGRRFAAWRARLPDAEPERLLAECDALGGRLVCPGEAEWPSQLDDLGDRRPYALWVRGDQDLRFGCLRSVAIVGSRSATSYGVNVAAEMGAELADRGWTVVSGGAWGIDAAAHRGVLAADGLTVAVFACGVDVTYPSSHGGLFSEIARYGLLVSELPPGAPPTRSRFLVRNRTIAALTRGTVVVEAARRSGAISTARHARDLRRAVMVVPGPVTSAASAGCHTLLREWGEAVCVTDTTEVLDLVGLIGDDLAPERRGPVLDRDRLDPVARDVLDAIPARGGAGAARIAVSAGVDLDTALASLGALSAGGFVERCAKGWRLRRRPPDS